MKISSKKLPHIDFKPFELTFSVESRKEAQALYLLFNYTPITNTIYEAGIDCDKVRSELISHNADVSDNDMFIKNYKELERRIKDLNS